MPKRKIIDEQRYCLGSGSYGATEGCTSELAYGCGISDAGLRMPMGSGVVGSLRAQGEKGRHTSSRDSSTGTFPAPRPRHPWSVEGEESEANRIVSRRASFASSPGSCCSALTGEPGRVRDAQPAATGRNDDCRSGIISAAGDVCRAVPVQHLSAMSRRHSLEAQLVKQKLATPPTVECGYIGNTHMPANGWFQFVAVAVSGQAAVSRWTAATSPSAEGVRVSSKVAILPAVPIQGSSGPSRIFDSIEVFRVAFFQTRKDIRIQHFAASAFPYRISTLPTAHG
eukprot:CAMPEP_0177783948 /NCGR_PEP_ID=MMETSP0491_2-20121128/19406_1 /TAXON_ID=63592 /ORGANISM="Tetraselmis chuii, Strain PLY429" /LENGTH=282 /DNA_ID=CAMNT_0019304615 /DNA_START=227 /DNA_END=1076 /DNA_ORIENTATION=+